ncbi:ppsC [Symbiodinium sp. CCMP2592]|nr:ppsC [Symbiodinium sp. CCMP2592]
METVESLVPPRDTGDSDPEWEKPDDDVALARATLAHNLSAHEDETVNSTLTSFTTLEVDETALDLRLQEMDAAMARLLTKGNEKVVVKEESQLPSDMAAEAAHHEDSPAAAMDTDPAGSHMETTTEMDTSGPEVPTPGDFVPEGGASDEPMGSGDSSKAKTVFRIEGFPDDFPGIGKKSADLAQQLTKEEIVYQIYKRQLAQEKMLAAPYNRARRGVGHSSMGKLDPGSTGATLMCPNCFADWQGQDNKVEGKCKLCQKTVIAVDKGPPSAEIKLGSASWLMFCGPQGVTWHTDADEAQKAAASVDIGSWAQPPPRPTDQKELSFAHQVPMALRLSLAHTVATQPFDEVQFSDKDAGDRPHLREDWQPSQETRAFHAQLAAAMEITKKSSGPVDKDSKKLTEEQFLDHINPQLDVIVEMQAGAQSVEEAKGASILRQLDTEKLRSLLKRGQGNKRMQEEGAQRSKLLRPVADSIDTWGTQLRAALEMNVFNPDSPLEAMKDRYMTRSGGLSSTGAFGPEEQSPETLLGVAVGSVEFQIMKVQGPLDAPTWAKPLPAGEKLLLEMRTHPCSFKQPFFEPIALTKEEIDAQVAMGTRPPLDKIIGPFHAEGDGGTHWQKEVQTWDLVSLFSCFGHTYSARHLYAVWSHLPITIQPHTRGAKNKQQNLQRRDDHRMLMKEAKEFVILHDLPVPTTNQEWKQLYREMGSIFAAKVFINRTPQVVLDLPVADIHDSKQHMRLRAVCDERITLPLKTFRDFPEIYNSLSHSLGQESMVEAKMAWRCNTVQWWTARLKPEYAGPIYRKLGYSESHIQGLGLGDRDTSAAFGAERILLDPESEQERALPPITPNNVSSVASDDYKKKNVGDKTAHVFWAKMECGLVLSSVSPWEIVDKKKGETRGGYVCRRCKGFWRSGRGASRFLLITGGAQREESTKGDGSRITFQHLSALKEVLDVSPSEALGPAEVAEARHQAKLEPVEVSVESSEPEGRLAFGGLVSLRQSELRLFLAEELERSEDMNALCLAMLCVANFAAYERKVLADEKGGQKLGKYLPLEDMARLLRGVVRTLKSIPSFDDDNVANTMTLHALRFFCNLLAFEVDFITAELQHLNVLEEVGKLFDHWFKDEDKIEDDKLFLQTLQSFILLLRWEMRGRTQAISHSL